MEAMEVMVMAGAALLSALPRMIIGALKDELCVSAEACV